MAQPMPRPMAYPIPHPVPHPMARPTNNVCNAKRGRWADSCFALRAKPPGQFRTSRQRQLCRKRLGSVIKLFTSIGKYFVGANGTKRPFTGNGRARVNMSRCNGSRKGLLRVLGLEGPAWLIKIGFKRTCRLNLWVHDFLVKNTTPPPGGGTKNRFSCRSRE